MVSALREFLVSESIDGLQKYYSERFKKIVESSNEDANMKERTLLKRSRFWIDSLVLGGKETLRKEAIRIWGEMRGQKKVFGKVIKREGEEVLSIRQLIIDT